MLDRLRELRKELSELEYVLRVKMVIQNLNYEVSIGTKYDTEKKIELINNTVPVVKRMRGYMA